MVDLGDPDGGAVARSIKLDAPPRGHPTCSEQWFKDVGLIGLVSLLPFSV